MQVVTGSQCTCHLYGAVKLTSMLMGMQADSSDEDEDHVPPAEASSSAVQPATADAETQVLLAVLCIKLRFLVANAHLTNGFKLLLGVPSLSGSAYMPLQSNAASTSELLLMLLCATIEYIVCKPIHSQLCPYTHTHQLDRQKLMLQLTSHVYR